MKNPVKLLYDTGATRTCISKKVFEELKLKELGISKIQSASQNNHEVKTTFISMDIPINGIRHGAKMNGALVLLNLSSQGVDVIIGMDLIQMGVLIIQGSTYTLAF